MLKQIFLVIFMINLALGQQQAPENDWHTRTNRIIQPTSLSAIKAEANDLGKAAVKLLAALLDQILDNFGPALVRAKRSAESRSERDYLDVLVTCVGAVMDRQMCRKRITCQTGKVMQKLPGMATYMTIADALVMPEYMHKSDWYNIVKESVNDPDQDMCVVKYQCDLAHL